MLDCIYANQALNMFREQLIALVDRFAPMQRLKMRLSAPDWLNGDYLAHCDERAYCAKKFDKCPCPYHLELKLNAETHTKNLRDDLKRDYFETQLHACKGDMKKTWRLIRKFWPGKGKGTNIESINGKKGNVEMANEINEYA